MDITRFNAQVALDGFKQALARCEFCAFDEEMTGVDCPDAPSLVGASSALIYESRRKASELFNAFQFGIALFIPNPEKPGTYEVMPYNFFLLNGQGDIRLDLSTIPFHVANKMDFNLWLSSGLCYYREDEEASLRAQFCAAPTLSTSEDKQVFGHVVDKVKAWIASEQEKEVQRGNADEEDGKQEMDLCKRLSLSEACSYAVAKALKHYFETQTEIPVSFHYEGKPHLGENMIFSVKKLDEEKWREACERAVIDRDRKLRAALGFRDYWKAIMHSKKPMVGHNCFQDVLFLLHMHEEKLPSDYADFKKLAHRALPILYDSKTLATKLSGDASFAYTHLENVYNEVRRRFKCTSAADFRAIFHLPAGFYGYDDDALRNTSRAHEAGYDAYMTGVCFHFLRKLHNDDITRWQNVLSVYGSSFFCCIDAEKDELVFPSTFIIKSSVPFHLEQLEALLFASVDDVKTIMGNKVDVKKLPYIVHGVSKNESDLFISARVVFWHDETVETVADRLKRASSAKMPNVKPDLVPFLTVERLE